MDGFLSQVVLGLHGRVATRKEVIEYVAYQLHGVHNNPTKARTEVDELLDQFRQGTIKHGEAEMPFDLRGSKAPPVGQFIYDEHQIDFVLHAIYSTITYIMISPDVEKLEAFLKAEFKAA